MSSEIKKNKVSEGKRPEQESQTSELTPPDAHMLDVIRMEFADTAERYYYIFKKILEGKLEEYSANHLAEILLKAMNLRQESQPEITEIACRKGCAHCCYNLVTASAPELSFLADHIQSLPAEMSSKLQENIRLSAEKVQGLTAAERISVSVPCPLLGDEGACLVYEHRPLSCRAFVSFDVEACIAEIAGQDIEVPSGPNGQTQRLLLIIAFKRALKEQGRDIASLEMITGLNRILSNPDIMSQWEAGESVFDQEVYGDRAAHEVWLEKMVEDLTSYQLQIEETDLSYIPGEKKATDIEEETSEKLSQSQKLN